MLKKITLGIVIAVFAILIILYFLVRNSKTDYSFQIESTHVQAPVKIIYDQFGIPHIYAKSQSDAMFALGYVHASERLWQMDLLRRVGSGTLSEIFGEKMLSADKFLRTLGIAQNSAKSADSFRAKGDKTVVNSVDQYISGINYFVESANLPLEYTLIGQSPAKFNLNDVYNIAGYMGYSFALALKTDPLADWIKNNLGQEYYNSMGINPLQNNTKIPKQEGEIMELCYLTNQIESTLPIPQFIGSNAWVISSKKSKSGKVLFANDAHIAFSTPSVWYEAHIVCPEIEYYGNHLAGFPFPLIGHTKKHAWGLTMFENDDIDLYREQIKNDKYLHDGQWKDLAIRNEVINIKGKSAVEIKVRESHHGPLISDVTKVDADSSSIALWWVYTRYSDNQLLECAYKFSRAKNMDEFYLATSRLHAPGLNIMYGDSDDNIAWWASAKLPIRPKHIDSKTIIDGTKSNNDVLAWLDFSQNPKSINPQTGFVFSANNEPETSDSNRIPGYYYSGNSRASQINDYLSKDEYFDNQYSKKIQLDDYSPVYHKINAILCDILIKENLSDQEKNGLKYLSNWDAKHNIDQIAPTIYYKWMYNCLEMTYKDELGDSRFEALMSTIVWERSFPALMELPNSIWWDNTGTTNKEQMSEIVAEAYKKSIAELEKTLGKSMENWRWGNVHTLNFEHAMSSVKPLDKIFNIGPFEAPSGKDALNKMSFSLGNDGKYKVSSGPSMRIVIDFADVENSESVIPTGQSGNFMSPFYSDQTTLYLQGKYRKQLMNLTEVEKAKYSESTISVKK